MPWISKDRLRELEEAARPRLSVPTPSSLWPKPDHLPTVQQVMDAFRTLWPEHSQALRAMSKKHNPYADQLTLRPDFVAWETADVKTLLTLAKARRDESKADGLRTDVAALRAGIAVTNPLRPEKTED